MNGRAASAWHEVAATAEVIEQAAGSHDRLVAEGPTDEERAEAREALLRVTDASRRLATFLDTLADRYVGTGVGVGLSEPSAAHVALDQAAAAAEDMGACTKLAAQAIEDEE